MSEVLIQFKSSAQLKTIGENTDAWKASCPFQLNSDHSNTNNKLFNEYWFEHFTTDPWIEYLIASLAYIHNHYI